MEKRFKNGLVLGKFYGLHLGHKHLIDSALEQCEMVYVMICSLKSEKIPGDVRFGWLKEIYKNTPNIEIIHCADENPQHPEECNSVDEFYNDYWVPTVYNKIKTLDCVFTSEEYGDEFAHYLGIQHVLVDLDRKKFEISGTKVRNNIFDNWNLIPEPVQRYFKKKIVIMGSESTGKSTIVKRLAEHYNSDYVEEYGRTYVETVSTKNLTEKDFENIAVGHAEEIKKKEKLNKNMFLFVDTEAIVTKTFFELYLGYKSRNHYIDNIIEEQHFDLVLLLAPTVPWISDGTRDFPKEEDRWTHFELIRKELIKNNISFRLISHRDYDERFNKCLSCVEELKKL